MSLITGTHSTKCKWHSAFLYLMSRRHSASLSIIVVWEGMGEDHKIRSWRKVHALRSTEYKHLLECAGSVSVATLVHVPLSRSHGALDRQI